MLYIHMINIQRKIIYHFLKSDVYVREHGAISGYKLI